MKIFNILTSAVFLMTVDRTHSAKDKGDLYQFGIFENIELSKKHFIREFDFIPHIRGTIKVGCKMETNLRNFNIPVLGFAR